MITHDLGRFYWASLKVTKHCPLIHTGYTRSYEKPYRWARSVYIRYWPGRALELGRWEPPVNPFEDEVDTLARVLQSKLPASQHEMTGGVHEVLEQEQRKRLP